MMVNNKKIWNAQFKFKKKVRKNNRLEIVEAKVIEIKKDELILEIVDGRIGRCRFSHISDFEFEKIAYRFELNSVHNFAITKHDELNDIYLLNYKIIHPMEIKDKRRSIPTLSHDRNLRKFLRYILDNKTD